MEFYKDEVKDVVEQVINMLTNNVIESNGSEGFECWCNDGEVFENNGHTGAELKERKRLVERLAPFVDRLSEEIDDICEGKYQGLSNLPTA